MHPAHGNARRRTPCRSAAIAAAIAAALAAAIFIQSCGGPYTAKRVPLAGDKLALADALFTKGKFGDAAVEYRDFLASFAGDERSDYAQFRLAESLRLDEQYATAAIEYRILVNDYGYSEYVDDAFYLEGLCAFKQAPRAERDQTKSLEAIDRIKRFLELFPTSPRRAEAEQLLRAVHDRLGKKDFLNAKVYFTEKHYRAALVYFDKVVTLYPETTWAARSRYYRGRVHEVRGERDQAVAEYEAAAGAAAAFDEKADASRRLAVLGGGAGAAEKRSRE